MGIIKSIFGTYSSRELKRIEPIKQAVLDLEQKYQEMDDNEDLKKVKRLTIYFPTLSLCAARLHQELSE